MSDYGDEWSNHIRRIAHEAVGARQFKGTLVCTAYNPKTHAVKGMIQPHGIESGWVPVATHHVGNNYGILVGPKVGDSKKLDGQVFDLHFDQGDPNTLVAHHRQFSTPEKPPEVQSGEILIMREGGNKLFMDKDDNITTLHKTGTKIVINSDGSIMVDAGSKDITVQTTGTHRIKGMVEINGS